MNCPEVTELSEDKQFKIRLCVEEVEENILAYSGTKWIEVWVENDDNELEFGFMDGGVEFDPLSKDDPDLDATIEERQVGGLGIFICKKMMNSVDYHFENNCNILKLRMKTA